MAHGLDVQKTGLFYLPAIYLKVFCLPVIQEVQGNADPVQVDLEDLKQIVKKSKKKKK